MNETLFYCLVILLLAGCQNPRKANTSKRLAESETPTSDCLCDFKKFGEQKINKDDYNIYLSGKGWNSNLKSCSFSWSEIVFNTIPPDTSLKLLKIHLLDLDKFEMPTNDNDYSNDSIKKYVISIYTRDNIKKNYSIKYDPFNTGKYPKPKE